MPPRSGFLIAAYLVEEFDYSADMAVDCFRKAREPGIYKEGYLKVPTAQITLLSQLTLLSQTTLLSQLTLNSEHKLHPTRCRTFTSDMRTRRTLLQPRSFLTGASRR